MNIFLAQKKLKFKLYRYKHFVLILFESSVPDDMNV